MDEKIKEIKEEAIINIFRADNEKELEKWRVYYLGRNGEVTKLFRELSHVTASKKPKVGSQINKLKEQVSELLTEKKKELDIEKFASLAEEEKIDVTKPAMRCPIGEMHPVTKMTHDIWHVFQLMGFEVLEGPEMETDEMNFQVLNIPKDHPSRDMQDTFYLNNDLLLRTHTSAVQGRVMSKRQPPLRVVATGKCYRRDDDISHTPMFHQFEGFVVDNNVTMADLKGTLTQAMRKLLGNEALKVRFRISYFPFVEPGAEFDVSCTLCNGKGCRTCKHTGWLEMGGCGMIHPNVLKSVGYDADKWQGYAFGFGIERPIMIKHEIPDLRLFFQNDIRFLSQF